MTTTDPRSAEPRLDPERLSAWRGFLTAHARLIGDVEERLREAGQVPLAWYDVLLALREAPARRLRMHELAERVVLSRSGLTRLVDRLEQAGLLAREACPEDRRGQHAVLTRAGAEALRAAWPVYERAIAERFGAHLSDADTRRLAAAFRRMLDGAEP